MAKKAWKVSIGCCLGLIMFHPAISLAETYYADPAGTGVNCSLENPCDLKTGIGLLKAGDTLYLRKGSYQQAFSIGASGTDADHRIVVSGYPGEAVVIDGNNKIPGGDENNWYTPLVTVHGDWVTVRDLEVKDGWGMGVSVDGKHGEVINIYSHGNFENGILLRGDFGLVEGCQVFYNAKSNEFGARTRDGFWASGLSAARQPTLCIIRKNIVWENWGEGLSSYEATYTTIEDNIVHNNYSTNIYLSDTHHTILQRNIIYNTTDGATIGYGGNVGIMLGDEKAIPTLSSNNTIVNNFVLGCHKNFYAWFNLSGSGLHNVLVAYNTFVNSSEDSNGFGNFSIGAGGVHNDSMVQNNMVVQEDGNAVCGVYVNAGVTFLHNLWSTTGCNSAPGEGDVVTTAAGLAKEGPTGKNLLTSSYFTLLPDSLAIDAGESIVGISEDFFRNPRPVGDFPDIGGQEYGSTPIEDKTPPMPPANLRIEPKT